MKKNYQLIIDNESAGLRIDAAIIRNIPTITRSSLKNHSTSIFVNNKTVKLSYKCKEGDDVKFELEWDEFENIIAEDIPLDIIYEDENYIVINKKYDMVVHPSKGNIRGTVVNALLGAKKALAENDDNFRPGIVHRLDKETSGILIIAKNIDSHEYLSSLFRERKILKMYHAVVKGFFTRADMVIESNIGRHPRNRKKMAVVKNGGKNSITVVENVIHYGEYSYLDIKLLTGRTHQIRVHLSDSGYPVLGDKIYSRGDKNFSDIPLCLAAYRLAFEDKFSGKYFDFQIKDPFHMNNVLNNLRNKSV